MFVLCPQCQFLVAMDPTSGQPPMRCTRCDALLLPEGMPVAPIEANSGIETGETGIEAAVDGGIAANATPVPASDGGEVPTMQPATADTDVQEESDDDSAIAALAPEMTEEPAIPAPDVVPGNGTSAPGFVHRHRARIARAPRADRWTFVVIAALSLLLVLQLLLADRAALARDARWRPAMLMLCGALRCSLPPWREPTAFALLDRDVRPRPGAPGVLRVTATFRNDARWPQPWPTLLLTLSDLDGRAAGARVFSPREYLGSAPAQDTLASGQSAMLSMDVVEPGPRIVAFSFDFK